MTSIFMRAYAVILAGFGAGLLFLPELLVSADSSMSEISAQLVGAAFLGFASANWASRSSILGGIYGKAITAGNQVFAFIAAMILLNGLKYDPTLSYLALTIVMICGALFFTILQLRPHWIDRPKQSP